MTTEAPPVELGIPMRPTYTRGVLVALAGLDGAGKSTVADAVAERLGRAGLETVCVDTMSTSFRTSPQLRAYGTDVTAALSTEVDVTALCLGVAADRLSSVRRDVLPSLARRSVVCDRYVYTALADLWAWRRPPSELRALVGVLGLFPRPDLAIYARAPAEACHARVDARGDEGHKVHHLSWFVALGRAYDDIAAANDLAVVDTATSLAATRRRVDQLVEDLLRRADRSGPVPPREGAPDEPVRTLPR